MPQTILFIISTLSAIAALLFVCGVFRTSPIRLKRAVIIALLSTIAVSQALHLAQSLSPIEWYHGNLLQAILATCVSIIVLGHVTKLLPFTTGSEKQREAKGNLTAPDNSILNRQTVLEQVVTNSDAIIVNRAAKPDWPILFMSRNVIQFGYCLGTLLARRANYANFIHPEDVGKVRGEISRRVQQGGCTFKLEYRLICSTGEVRNIEDHVTVMKDEAGRIIGYPGVIIDVSERDAAIQAYQDSEQQLQDIIDNTEDVVIQFDSELDLLFINQAGARLAGVASEMCLGRSVLKLFHPDDRMKFQELIENWFQHTKARTRLENHIQHGNGGMTRISWVFMIHYDRDGQPANVNGIGRTILNRQRSRPASDEHDSHSYYRFVSQGAKEKR